MSNDADVLDALSRPAIALGCATFGSTVSVAESVRVIEAAVEGGVRHLDVARSYGYGQAEDAVGRFLRTGRHDDVTVTTKVGIRPPGGLRQVAALRAVARRVAALSPGLKRRIAGVASAGVEASRFGVDDLSSSLAASLSALRLDRVDVLLLHECTADDVTDEVLGWLHDRIARGDIGTWGIATAHSSATAVLTRVPVPVVQVPAPAAADLPPALLRRDGALIRHSVLRAVLEPLERTLAAPGRRTEAEERLGLALGPRDLPELVLRLALAEQPAGPVLVGTRRVEHAHSFGRIRPLEPQLVPVLQDLVREAAAGAAPVR